jgi:hypothetical protein
MNKLYLAKMWVVLESDSLKKLKSDLGSCTPNCMVLVKDSMTELKNIQQLPEGITEDNYYSLLDSWGGMDDSGLTIGEWFEENSPEKLKKEKQQELKEMEKEMAKLKKEIASLG